MTISIHKLGVGSMRGALAMALFTVDSDDPVYLERLRHAQIAGVASYTPAAVIAGVSRRHELPAALPGTATIAPEALGAARDYARRMNSSVLMIWQGGALQSADFFKGITPGDLLPSKSLAKPIAAAAVGRALMLGKISSLDQSVADFIGEWRDTPKRAITIRQLLDMRSGLLPQGSSPDPTDVMNLAYLHPQHDAVIINQYPLVATPGVSFGYSNATGDLIAVLIERATGRRYSDFLARELFQRISAAGGSAWLDRPGGLAHSGCCLSLPAESYLRFAVLLLNDGTWNGRRLLPEGFVTAMHTGTVANSHYGLGAYAGEPYLQRRGFFGPESNARGVLHGEAYVAKDLFLLDGNANQVAYVIPSRQLVILRLGDVPLAQPEWDNAYLPNLLSRSLDNVGAALRPAFDLDVHPRAPDYSRRSAWVSLPRLQDAADRVASNERIPAAQASARADVFYVHPTTYNTQAHWNQDIADRATNEWTDNSVVARQATVFNACCRVYAPRYRQAATGALESTDGSGDRAFELAYEDIKSAFLYYLKHYNRGRPFILAGHSQGSKHLELLIAELIDAKPLQRLFIAAYTPGVSLSLGDFGHRYSSVSPCRTPTMTACIASWNSFEAAGNAASYRSRNEQRYAAQYGDAGKALLCVNPLSFDIGQPAAVAEANRGALSGAAVATGLPPLIAAAAGAACIDGVLRVTVPVDPRFRLNVLPNGMLHYHDIDLYYENIRANAVDRVNAYYSRAR
jgi:CubicO group peptidase (beta-lactamase class C family)